MRIGILAVFVLCFAIPTICSAEEKAALTLKAGDRIKIVKKGKLMTEFRELVDSYSQGRYSEKQHDARVTHVFKNGSYRIFDWTELQEQGKPPMLLTISTVVESSDLKPSVADSEDPADDILKEVLVGRNRDELRVELSDLNRVQLRSWRLDQEIAK